MSAGVSSSCTNVLLSYCVVHRYSFMRLPTWLHLVPFRIVSANVLGPGLEFIYRSCGFFVSFYPSTSNFLSSFHSTFHRRCRFISSPQVHAPSVRFLRCASVFKSLRLYLFLLDFSTSILQRRISFTGYSALCIVFALEWNGKATRFDVYVRRVAISYEQYF